MTLYQIFYNGSLAFMLELKSFSLGGFDPVLLTLIIKISALAASIATYIILKKRKLKKSADKKSLKIKKILRKIK